MVTPPNTNQQPMIRLHSNIWFLEYFIFIMIIAFIALLTPMCLPSVCFLPLFGFHTLSFCPIIIVFLVGRMGLSQSFICLVYLSGLHHSLIWVPCISFKAQTKYLQGLGNFLRAPFREFDLRLQGMKMMEKYYF